MALRRAATLANSAGRASFQRMKMIMKTTLLALSLMSFSLIARADDKKAPEPPPIANGTKMKCPVSGEEFTVKPTTQQLVYNGKRYAFCCPDCAPDFAKNPAKYAK